nr:MAG TPA: hypothetical protein [Caudoviricetes sp.]
MLHNKKDQLTCQSLSDLCFVTNITELKPRERSL